MNKYQVAIIGTNIGAKHYEGFQKVSDRFNVHTVCGLTREAIDTILISNNETLVSLNFDDVLKIKEIDIIDMVQNEILQGYFEEREFEDKIYEFVHEFIDNQLIYYKDQIEVIQELHLYDFSEMDSPQNIGQVAYMGIMDELHNSGKVFDKSNYKFTLADIT